MSIAVDGSRSGLGFDELHVSCNLLCNKEQNSSLLFSLKLHLYIGGSDFNADKNNLGIPKIGKWSVASYCITPVLICLLLRLLMT